MLPTRCLRLALRIRQHAGCGEAFRLDRRFEHTPL